MQVACELTCGFPCFVLSKSSYELLSRRCGVWKGGPHGGEGGRVSTNLRVSMFRVIKKFVRTLFPPMWGLEGRSPRQRAASSVWVGRSTLPSATLGRKTTQPPISGTKVSYEIINISFLLSFFDGRSTLPGASLGQKMAQPPFSGTKVSCKISANIIYPGAG